MSATLGTVGTALARSAPPDTPDTPPAGPEAPIPSDMEEGKFKDSPEVRSVLDEHRQAMAGVRDRLRSAQQRSDALQPPVMVKPPPAPEVTDTPIAERWGSLAMMLAGFGGLLTRQPLTASLNAMSEVNHAYNEGDAAKAKLAFDTWKIHNDNAQKMNEFTNKAYEGALSKISHDYSGAVSEARVISMTLKDDMASALFAAGRPDDAMRMITGRVALVQKTTAATDTLVKRQAEMAEWTGTFQQQNGRPPNAQEVLAHWNQQPKETDADPKPEQPGVAEEQRMQRIAASDFQDKNGRPPDPANPADRVALDRLIEQQKIALTGDKSQAGAAGRAAGTPPKPAPRETVGSMDAGEIKRLVAGGLSYTEAKRQVLARPESLSQLDANEVMRLVREEGISEPEARERVKRQSTPEKPLSAAASENMNLQILAEDAVTRASGRPFDPKNPDDKVAKAKEIEHQRALAASDVTRERERARLAIHDDHDALDHDTVVNEAHALRLTGRMSALGLGSSIARKQILDERTRQIREEGGSIASDIARQSDVHALQGAMNTLARSKTAISNFEATARKEADLAASLAPAGVGSGEPIINRWIQGGRRAIAGNTDVVRFDAALISFKNEYARIMSSPTATGGQTTDAARSEADTLINGAMTYDQITGVIETMKIGMNNRITSINEEYEATKSRIAQLGGEVGGPGGQGAPPVPNARKAPDGHWYVDDPNKPGGYLRVDQ
jgi:hypothetical protein